jgi:hypothetical protein
VQSNLVHSPVTNSIPWIRVIETQQSSPDKVPTRYLQPQCSLNVSVEDEIKDHFWESTIRTELSVQSKFIVPSPPNRYNELNLYVLSRYPAVFF